MEKNIKFNTVHAVLLCVGLLVIIFGIFLLGRSCSGESGDRGHSEQYAEYGRQMGRTTELIGELDAGLGECADRIGRVKNGFAELAANNRQDAIQLRAFAQRLLEISSDVKTLENDIDSLRSLVRGFLGDNSDNTGDEIDNLF